MNETKHKISHFTTLLEAVHTLSSENELGKFLSQLMKIVIENTVAQKVVFILKKESQLQVVSKSEKANNVCIEFQPTPLDVSDDVSHVIINDIKSTGKKVVIEDVAHYDKLKSDPYVMNNHPKSIVSLPIIYQSKIIGMLYLENRLKTQAFSQQQIELLEALSSHIAQFMKNVLYYEELREEIFERKQAENSLAKAFSVIKKLKEQLQAENLYLQEEIKVVHNYEEIVGQSKAIQDVLQKVEQVAYTDSSVLILGETGTGKELFAHAIHNLSPRKERALVKVNCAALPLTLIESELFGHEKGAFTGAASSRIGRFEVADGGTLFLDEVTELSPALQAKLLRVLQEGQFERLGSSKTLQVDVRVVAATNKKISEEVRNGKFREDLYYRLNVFPINVPPLRQRQEDIPQLVWFFVREYSKKMGKKVETIPKKCMDALIDYSWPGNVRELKNVIERAIILSTGSTLNIELPKKVEITSSDNITNNITLEEMEKRHITEVLKDTDWRIRGKNGAAEILGLKPTTLESRMLKLGIKRHG